MNQEDRTRPNIFDDSTIETKNSGLFKSRRLNQRRKNKFERKLSNEPNKPLRTPNKPNPLDRLDSLNPDKPQRPSRNNPLQSNLPQRNQDQGRNLPPPQVNPMNPDRGQSNRKEQERGQEPPRFDPRTQRRDQEPASFDPRNQRRDQEPAPFDPRNQRRDQINTEPPLPSPQLSPMNPEYNYGPPSQGNPQPPQQSPEYPSPYHQDYAPQPPPPEQPYDYDPTIQPPVDLPPPNTRIPKEEPAPPAPNFNQDPLGPEFQYVESPDFPPQYVGRQKPPINIYPGQQLIHLPETYVAITPANFNINQNQNFQLPTQPVLQAPPPPQQNYVLPQHNPPQSGQMTPKSQFRTLSQTNAESSPQISVGHRRTLGFSPPKRRETSLSRQGQSGPPSRSNSQGFIQPVGINLGRHSPAPAQIPSRSHGISAPQIQALNRPVPQPQVPLQSHRVSAPQVPLQSHRVSAPQVQVQSNGTPAQQVQPQRHVVQAPQTQVQSNGVPEQQVLPQRKAIQAPLAQNPAPLAPTTRSIRQNPVPTTYSTAPQSRPASIVQRGLPELQNIQIGAERLSQRQTNPKLSPRFSLNLATTAAQSGRAHPIQDRVSVNPLQLSNIILNSSIPTPRCLQRAGPNKPGAIPRSRSKSIGYTRPREETRTAVLKQSLPQAQPKPAQAPPPARQVLFQRSETNSKLVNSTYLSKEAEQDWMRENERLERRAGLQGSRSVRGFRSMGRERVESRSERVLESNDAERIEERPLNLDKLVSLPKRRTPGKPKKKFSRSLLQPSNPPSFPVSQPRSSNPTDRSFSSERRGVVERPGIERRRGEKITEVISKVEKLKTVSKRNPKRKEPLPAKTKKTKDEEKLRQRVIRKEDFWKLRQSGEKQKAEEEREARPATDARPTVQLRGLQANRGEKQGIRELPERRQFQERETQEIRPRFEHRANQRPPESREVPKEEKEEGQAARSRFVRREIQRREDAQPRTIQPSQNQAKARETPRKARETPRITQTETKPPQNQALPRQPAWNQTTQPPPAEPARRTIPSGVRTTIQAKYNRTTSSNKDERTTRADAPSQRFQQLREKRYAPQKPQGPRRISPITQNPPAQPVHRETRKVRAEQSTAELKNVNNSLDDLRKKITSGNQETSSTQRLFEQAEQERDRLRTENSQLKSQLDSLRARVESGKDRERENLRAELEARGLELAELRKRNMELESQLHSKTAEANSMADAMQELEGEIKLLRQSQEAQRVVRESGRAGLEEEDLALREQMKEYHLANVEFKQANDALMKAKKTLEDDCNTLYNQRSQLKEENAQLKQRLQSLQEELLELRHGHSTPEQELKELRVMNEDLKEQLDDKRLIIMNLRQQIDENFVKFNKEIRFLNKKNQELEEYIDENEEEHPPFQPLPDPREDESRSPQVQRRKESLLRDSRKPPISESPADVRSPPAENFKGEEPVIQHPNLETGTTPIGTLPN